MSLHKTYVDRIQQLKKAYDLHKNGKESLLNIILEAELPERVYNSNAIENSTLTLKETERILMELKVARQVTVREVFEAKNLARVFNYIHNNSQKPLTLDLILFLHQMLLTAIKDSIAGRFRKENEFVRVGTHIAPASQHIEPLLTQAILEYTSNESDHLVEKISKFHLELEYIHPFNDGNGRIGRVITQLQLIKAGYPPIIVRNKNKEDYYQAFTEYDADKKTTNMDKIIALALIESLHKRLAYLQGQQIIKLSQYAKNQEASIQSLLNRARRQQIPAFREKGVWKIGTD